MLRSDKGADGVDVEVFVEIGELERERVIGRVGGYCTGFSQTLTREKKRGVFRAAIHTIVNDDTWDTERCLNLGERIDDGAGIGEVTLDVDLVGSVVGLGRFPRGYSNLVAFGRKSFGYTRTDSGSRAEDEDDGRCSRHGASCGRRK